MNENLKEYIFFHNHVSEISSFDICAGKEVYEQNNMLGKYLGSIPQKWYHYVVQRYKIKYYDAIIE